MIPTPIDDARLEHFQAKRRLRRLQEQAKTEAAGWRVVERGHAIERVHATLARLNRLEAEAGLRATRPDDPERNPSPLETTRPGGAGSRPDENETETEPQTNRT